MTDTVPLNKLVLSPRNVRKTNGDEDIAGLAESIKSKGLLQNLVVSPAADGKLFEVDAGGRRWRALQLLAERKDLAKNFPVPVKVIAPDAATESSLAENLQKVSMNPADEVEAFAKLAQADGWLDGALRPANSHYWATPTAPKGYTARWASVDELTQEQRAESFALFAINDDATVERDERYCFVKLAPTDVGEPASRSREEAEAEYQAQRREGEIRYRAARLAAPKVAGTALEGRTFWPLGQRWIEPYGEDDEGNAVVALLVKIPLADLDAQMSEAERRYELELKELAEEEAAQAAEDEVEPATPEPAHA